MTAHPHHQSTLLSLPREIRNIIYLELWRSCGLRQHILWHYDDTTPHFCHWPCRAKFRVDDPVQAEIETIREQLGFARGRSLDLEVYARRLRSPWLDHVVCGEEAEGVHGLDAGVGRSTGLQSCWKTGRGERYVAPGRSPYMAMLLSCKTISSECVESIYESTCFIFTDPVAFQFFIGHCRPEPAPKSDPTRRPPRPSFFEHARNIEVSMPHNFSVLLSCADPWLCDDGVGPHANTFHWLRLERFRRLRSVKIWVAARGMIPRGGEGPRTMDIDLLPLESLREMMSSFGKVEVTISAPLVADISPEDGYVEDLALPGVHLWKRGTGDRFHPHFYPVVPGNIGRLVRSRPERAVGACRVHREYEDDYSSRLGEMREGHREYVRLQRRIYRGEGDSDEGTTTSGV